MKRISILLILAFLLSACTDDTSMQPPPTVDAFADCGNGDPVSSYDSLMHNWPYPKYRISQLRISPFNGWWAGDYLRYKTVEGETFAQGVFVYDPMRDMPIAQFDDAWGHRWSPDGKTLILIQGFQLYRIDIPSMDLRNLTEGYDVALGSWAPDGSKLFFSHNGQKTPGLPNGMYSMNVDGSEKRWEGDPGAFALLLNDSTFMGFKSDSLIFLHRGSGLRTTKHIPELDEWPYTDQLDISNSRNLIVFCTVRKGSLHDPWGNGLWLLDTKTWTPRKIRGAQWWNNLYYPTWAPNGNIYASVYCRKDSSSMVWEFDLNGNPLRRITEKIMRVWMR